MNRVKYRPVGEAGPIVEVRVSQSKRAINPSKGNKPMPSLKNANANMDRMGYVRAGGRHA